MKRPWIWALGLALVAAAVLLATGVSGGASASTLGRGPLGWRGLAVLLERHGVGVTALDRPLEHRDAALEATGGDPTLIVGFPWQRGDLGWDPAPLLGFVRRGGRLVLGTSNAAVPSWPESRLLDALGIEQTPRARAGPLRPIRWWRERRQGALWPASEAAPWRDPLATGALAALARPPAEGSRTVLATDEAGSPIAFVLEAGEGEVWVLPSQALANAFLGETGNAALGLALARRMDGGAVFDEYHHGLLSAEAGLAEPAGRAFDAVLLQLGLLWLLAVAAFAWRFGPSWPANPRVDDAHRAFLVGLGALHHRLGHEREAARQLVRRVAVYDPSLVPPRTLGDALERAETVPFAQLARELSRRPEPSLQDPPGPRS